MHTDRRAWLLMAGTGLAAVAVRSPAAEPARQPFGFCLNTSTIRGQKLGIVEEVAIAAKAGYDAIEPWTRELDEYVRGGGSLKDLGKRIADAGLKVPSSIGFAEWVVDDDDRRKKGLDAARRDMEMVRAIGGERIAAPPVGATDRADLNLVRAAERYRALAEAGDETGVIPQVEVWGFSKSVSRLGEAVLVAMESGHPKACVLPDVYHLYKGGSDFTGVGLLRGVAVGIFHVNDYPRIERGTIKDADRVYPGDGIAPLKPLVRTLRDLGYRGYLSLELFNPEYWKQDALEVARTGLDKTRAVVRDALAG